MKGFGFLVNDRLQQLERPEYFKRFALAIVLLAVVIRATIFLINWSNWYWHSGNIHDDWNKFAINLAEYGTFGFSAGEESMLRAPFFPLIELPFYLLFGENYAMWSIGLLLFDCLTCLLLIYMSRRLWGNRAALLAGLYYAVHLAVVYYTAQIEQFTSMLPLVFLWFYLFSYWDLKGARKWLPWTLGIISGLMALNKSVYLPIPLISAAAFIWFKRDATRPHRLFAPVMIYLITTAVVIAPWTYRNYQVSNGKLIPIQSYFWGVVWQDIIIHELDKERGVDRPAGETLQHILACQMQLLNSTETPSSRNLKGALRELHEEKVFAQASLEWIRRYPGQFIQIKLNNLWQFWIGAENLHKTLLFLMMQIVYLGLALTGLWFLIKYRQVHQVRLGILLILLVWIEYSLVFAWGRFSLDLVPVLAIMFGLGVDTHLRRKPAVI